MYPFDLPELEPGLGILTVMKMPGISVLVDNSVCMDSGRGIWAEHGLSYWVDNGRARVLFDTGASGDVLMNNVRRMGLELSSADAIVLSHGHHDHVGGLEAALKALPPEAPIYMHPDAQRPKHSGRPGQARRSDSPFFMADRFGEGRKVVRSRQPLELAPGIWMTGQVPRRYDIEDTGGRFFIDSELSQPDPIPDDQALFLPGAAGTTVILGCAHAGIINTLEYVQELSGGAPIACVIGGTHLEKASEERIEWTIEKLRCLKVREIHPCHCTGMEASLRLSKAIGGASCPAWTGWSMVL